MSQPPLADKLLADAKKKDAPQKKKRREPVVPDGEDGGDVKPRSPKRRKTSPEPETQVVEVIAPAQAEPQVVATTTPVAVFSLIPTEEEVLAALALSMEQRDAWKKTCEAQIAAKVDKWAKAFRQRTFAAIAALSGQTESERHLAVIIEHVRIQYTPGKPHRDQYIVNEAMSRFRKQFKENLGAWIVALEIKDPLSWVKLNGQADGEKSGVIRAAVMAKMHVG